MAAALALSFKVKKGCTKVNVELVPDFDVDKYPCRSMNKSKQLTNFFWADKVSRWIDQRTGPELSSPTKSLCWGGEGGEGGQIGQDKN